MRFYLLWQISLLWNHFYMKCICLFFYCCYFYFLSSLFPLLTCLPFSIFTFFFFVFFFGFFLVFHLPFSFFLLFFFQNSFSFFLPFSASFFFPFPPFFLAFIIFYFIFLFSCFLFCFFPFNSLSFIPLPSPLLFGLVWLGGGVVLPIFAPILQRSFLLAPLKFPGVWKKKSCLWDAGDHWDWPLQDWGSISSGHRTVQPLLKQDSTFPDPISATETLQTLSLQPYQCA